MPTNVTDAINALVSSLQESNANIANEAPYVRAVAMMDALAATEKFLKDIWQLKRLGLDKPYRTIRESISLLIDGVEVEEFASLRKPQAEAMSTQLFKMDCAVAMDLFIHNGAKRMKAALKVVPLFPDLILKAETIADWRDKLIGNSDSELAEWFKLWTSTFKQENATDELVTFWLRHTSRSRGVQLKRQAQRVARSLPPKQPL